MAHALYNRERVEALSAIVPKFLAHVKTGDMLHLGIKTDQFFPPQWSDSTVRPIVEVVQVRNGGSDSAVVRGKIKSGVGAGKVVDLVPHTLDPTKLFEPSTSTYELWLQRSAPKRPIKTAAVKFDGLDELRKLVAELSSRLDSTAKEDEAFRKAMLARLPPSQETKKDETEVVVADAEPSKSKPPKLASAFDSDPDLSDED